MMAFFPWRRPIVMVIEHFQRVDVSNESRHESTRNVCCTLHTVLIVDYHIYSQIRQMKVGYPSNPHRGLYARGTVELVT